MRFLFVVTFFLSLCAAQAQDKIQLGLLKYNGGGDWYANLETSLPNLALFCNQQLGTNLDAQQAIVEAGDPALYRYPFIHLTGHGNIVFTDAEISNLRTYLASGGFLHVDDNYGLDPFIRPLFQKILPGSSLVEIPANYPLFSQPFSFPQGLPKIHEHDGNRPQALGLFHEGRLVCLYTFECDLGDGWESAAVHNDPEASRLKALQMGANIIQYVFTNAAAPVVP